MGRNDDFAIDLEDEVVRGAMAVHKGEVLPPPPKRDAAPPPKPKPGTPAPAPVAKAPPANVVEAPKSDGNLGVAVGTLAAAIGLAYAGQFVPGELLQHVTVFVLACFVGWQVVWSVSAALHTPLMSVTNAISGIILVGGLLQAGSGNFDVAGLLGAAAILFASINVAGGFLVTQRMLAMFRK
jgi:NAD(P) transhydrogenase subunit alpha